MSSSVQCSLTWSSSTAGRHWVLQSSACPLSPGTLSLSSVVPYFLWSSICYRVLVEAFTVSFTFLIRFNSRWSVAFPTYSECVCILPALPVLLLPLVRFLFMFDFGQEPLLIHAGLFNLFLHTLWTSTLSLLLFPDSLWSSYSSLWRPSRTQSSLHFNGSFSCLVQSSCPVVYWFSFSSDLLHPCLLPRLCSATSHRVLFFKAHPQTCLLYLVLC